MAVPTIISVNVEDTSITVELSEACDTDSGDGTGWSLVTDGQEPAPVITAVSVNGAYVTLTVDTYFYDAENASISFDGTGVVPTSTSSADPLAAFADQAMTANISTLQMLQMGIDSVEVSADRITLTANSTGGSGNPLSSVEWTYLDGPAAPSSWVPDASTNPTAAVVSAAGLYDFSVDGADERNGEYIEELDVEVYAVVVFTSANSTLTTTQQFALSVNATNTPVTYAWSCTAKPVGSTVTFDDDTLASPTATFDTAGEYTIQVIVTDALANAVTATQTFTVVTGWIVSILPDPEGNVPVQVGATEQFTASAVDQFDNAYGGAFTWAIHLNDPNGSVDASGLFTGVSAGTCFVRATIEGDSEFDLSGVDVYDALAVSSSADDSPLEGTETGLNAGATGGYSTLTYAWTCTVKPEGASPVFDDDTAENPTVTFDTSGDYTFRCDVTDSDENTAFDTVELTVTVPETGTIIVRLDRSRRQLQALRGRTL